MATKKASAKTPEQGAIAVKHHLAEVVDIGSLRPHPRNYRRHPKEQLEHIAESLRRHGFYRNVVIAEDGTILAGHGVVEAAKSIGLERVPVIRMPLKFDDPSALKVLAGDNELTRFADNDDRALSMLLADILKNDVGGLLGTGYDEQALSALLMVTRPASEIQDFDAANEWIGMPEFDPVGLQCILTLQFKDDAAREEVVAKLGIGVMQKMKQGKVWSGWYPPRPEEDLSSLVWKEGADGKPEKSGKKSGKKAVDAA
jgi:hypothetical protein